MSFSVQDGSQYLRSSKLPVIEGLRRIGRSLSLGPLEGCLVGRVGPFWFVAVSFSMGLIFHMCLGTGGLEACRPLARSVLFDQPGRSWLGTSPPLLRPPLASTASHRPSQRASLDLSLHLEHRRPDEASQPCPSFSFSPN
jgi:hypothetical protein